MKRKFGLKSIASKLTIMIAIVIIIPLIIMGSFVYNKADSLLTKEFENNTKVVMSQVNNSMDKLLVNYEQNMKMLSTNLNISDALYWYNTYAHSFIEGTLSTYIKSHDSSIRAYICLPKGEVISFPKESITGAYITEKEWYKSTISNKGYNWSNPYKDPITGEDMVTLSVQLITSKGEFGGVLGVDMPLSNITNTATKVNLGENGKVMLVDKNNIIVANTDKDEVGQELDNKEVKNKINTSKEGEISYEYNKEKKYGIYNSNEKLGWTTIGIINYKDINASKIKVLTLLILATIIISFVAILVAYLIIKKVTRRIDKLQENITSIGNGDLNISIESKSKDEIGETTNTLKNTVLNIKGLIQKINLIAEKVGNASIVLNESTNEAATISDKMIVNITDVTEFANDEVRNIEEGLEKTNILSNRIDSVSNSINNTKEKFNETLFLNKNGMEKVKLLIEKAKESNDSSKKVEYMIEKVNSATNAIEIIVETINDIAKETNLLALNASIEASRAGEYGKGFAVVADEVRKLAEESSKSTIEIDNLISAIKDRVNLAVDSMKYALSTMEEQFKVVSETENVLSEINSEIDLINNEVDRVILLNNVMLSKKNEIIFAIDTISSSAEETSAETEEISASVEQQLAAFDEVRKTSNNLNELIDNLNREISKFNI